MAYNINTLSFKSGEIIKADKLQFLTDYIRSLELQINNLSNKVANINTSNLMEKITSSRFMDIDGNPPITVPSGGT